MGNNKMEELVEKYEASGDELDLENRLRYAMVKTMCCGKEANTPLTRLFVMADLTGEELTCAFAEKVFAGKIGLASDDPEK